MPFISYENQDVVKTTNPWESNKETKTRKGKYQVKKGSKRASPLDLSHKEKTQNFELWPQNEKKDKKNLPIFLNQKTWPD